MYTERTSYTRHTHTHTHVIMLWYYYKSPAERRSVVRRRFRERTQRDDICRPTFRETRSEESEINHDGESTTVGKFVIFFLQA